MARNIPRELGESDAAGIRKIIQEDRSDQIENNYTQKSVFKVQGESGPENAVEIAGVSFFGHRGKEGKNSLLHVADGHVGQLPFTGFSVIGRKTTRRTTGQFYKDLV